MKAGDGSFGNSHVDAAGYRRDYPRSPDALAAAPFPEGSPNRIKQLEMFKGTDTAYALAKKYKLKTAWGTDILFDPKLATAQGEQLAVMTKWYSPPEILRMVTSTNAELFAMPGPRNPHPGKLGVIEKDAWADLLLVDGDPIANINLLADAEKTSRSS